MVKNSVNVVVAVSLPVDPRDRVDGMDSVMVPSASSVTDLNATDQTQVPDVALVAIQPIVAVTPVVAA